MSNPNILGTLVDPDQTYLVIQIHWSDTYLFPLNQGIEFIRAFSQGIKVNDMTKMELADSRTSLRIEMVPGRDIKEASLQAILGIAA